ncbi:hypothetical protein D3C86_1550850 [compost metagenome]
MLALRLLLFTQAMELLTDLLVAYQGSDQPLVAKYQLGDVRHMAGEPGLDVIGDNNPIQTLVRDVDVFGQHRLQRHQIRVAVGTQDQLEIPCNTAGDELRLVLQRAPPRRVTHQQVRRRTVVVVQVQQLAPHP